MSQAISGSRAKKELVRILGGHRVVQSEAHRYIMVYVDSPQSASAAVAFAQSEGIPVFPHFVGLEEPRSNEWSIRLNLERLNAVTEFSPNSRLASFQTGIRVESMFEWLYDRNLDLGISPETFSAMELWEFMLNPSPGRFGPRFGQKWKQVFAIKAVLPNGRLYSTSLAPARATGPDFSSLILLGRGRFGIPLEMTLRLQTNPRKKHYLAFALDSLADGLEPAWDVSRHTKPEYIELGTNKDRAEPNLPEHFLRVELWGEGNRLSVRRERVKRALRNVGRQVDIPYETLLGLDQTYGFREATSCQMFTSRSRLPEALKQIEQQAADRVSKVRVRGFVDSHACITVDCPSMDDCDMSPFHPVGVYGSARSGDIQMEIARHLDPNGIFADIESTLGGHNAI